MKCMTCSAEINPEWQACINRNVCPGCDGPIMNESAKVLLDEIREAFVKMPNDPSGLAGWLLSNYELRKIGTAEPVNFHRPPTNQPKEDVSGVPLKIANNPVNDMLKRAGVANQVEQNRQGALSKLAKQIKSGTLVEPEQFAPTEEEVEESGDVEAEEPPIAIPASKLSSAFVTVDSESVLPDMEVKEAFTQHFGGAEGVEEKYAQAQRMDRVRRQKNMIEGLSRGKNGFSRGGE